MDKKLTILFFFNQLTPDCRNLCYSYCQKFVLTLYALAG